ncbi:type II secretion system protein [Candidatus Peregrinibacteria bacterium]|nr:type II secretion system protein [Candidatus Peregrinibacteria bacterium]
MNKKGFTLVEILLVLTIFAISLGFAVIYSQTSQLNADINTQASILASNIRLLQSNANSGLTDGPNAVHFGLNSYTTFFSSSGSPYNELDPDNFLTQLPSTISIQNISLNGGGLDLIFDTPSGETANYGSLQLSSNQISKTRTININSLGAVSY